MANLKKVPPKFIALVSGLVISNVEGFSITKHLYGIKTGTLRALAEEYKKELLLKSPFDSPVGHLSLRCVVDQRIIVRPGSPILLLRRVDAEEASAIAFSLGRLPSALSLSTEFHKYQYYPIFTGIVIDATSSQVTTPYRTNYNFNITAMDLTRLLTKTSLLFPYIYESGDKSVLNSLLLKNNKENLKRTILEFNEKIYGINFENGKGEMYRHEYVEKILRGYAKNVQSGVWSDLLLGNFTISALATTISTFLKGSPILPIPIGIRRVYLESHKDDKHTPSELRALLPTIEYDTPWSFISKLKGHPWFYESFIREDTGDFIFRLNKTLNPNAWLFATTGGATRALSYLGVSRPNIGFGMNVPFLNKMLGYVSPNVVHKGRVEIGYPFMHSISPFEVKGTVLHQSSLPMKNFIVVTNKEVFVAKPYKLSIIKAAVAKMPDDLLSRFGKIFTHFQLPTISGKLYDENSERGNTAKSLAQLVRDLPRNELEYRYLAYFRVISEMIRGTVSIVGWKPISVGDHVKFSGAALFGEALRKLALDVGRAVLGAVIDRFGSVFDKLGKAKYYIPVPDDNIFYVLGKIYQAEIVGANTYREEMILQLGYGGTEFMRVAPPSVESVFEGESLGTIK